jgi:membrane-bound lytic murein transglycosylase MltF
MAAAARRIDSTGAAASLSSPRRRALLQAASAVAGTPLAALAQPADPLQGLSMAAGASAVLLGDLDAMLARRLVRAGVPYSRTLYTNDKGRERGLSAEMLRDFERWLNRRYAKQLARRPLTLAIIPTTRDTLIDDLADGRIDLAAGSLTMTPALLTRVDFYAPTDRAPGREVIVTGPASPAVDSMQSLSGKAVHVRASTSFHDSLVALNARFAQQGLAPIEITLLPDDMEDEDVLELVDAGALSFAVVEQWKGRIWARALPHLKLREDLVLRDDVRAGWAVRRGSPQLLAELDRFYRQHLKRHGLIEIRLADTMARAGQLRNPASGSEYKRFTGYVALFEKYGKQYGFDPLLLLAQGYQESGLKQNAVSKAGAIGLMQLMPATGTAMKVGDIRHAGPNVHAAAKYMDQLMKRHFADAPLNEHERTLFALASYNAGPGRIAQLRRLAEKRGLDPNRWFGQVERVAAEHIGMETTTYVRNIYKYYVAYSLAAAVRTRQEAVRDAALSNQRKSP